MTEKLDVLRLTFYSAPVTTFVLLPFYLKLEAPRYAQYHAGSGSYLYMGGWGRGWRRRRRSTELCMCVRERGAYLALICMVQVFESFTLCIQRGLSTRL